MALRDNPLYSVWIDMRRRCHNPKHKQYLDYGGRGIFVCPKWLNDFQQFCKDMGERPKNHSLERKDNEKGYSAKNCRWENHYDQALNRRKPKNNTSGYKGVSPTKYGTFRADYSKDGKRVRLGTFKTAIEAHNARQSYINERT